MTDSDKILFTPGPLTTSAFVKEAMLIDLGSRDDAFLSAVKSVREKLLRIGQVTEEEYTAILMQGSGTFGIESVLSSIIPAHGKLLILVNGAYGRRMKLIADIQKIDCVTLLYPEDESPKVTDLQAKLQADASITHVAVVHCETTTGIINPIQKYGEVVHELGKTYIVDAMSSFGAYPVPLADWHIDYLISSANKCIEGVPGFSFILANKANLRQSQGMARSLSLDLYAQWMGLERNGQFRFTPPTHVILAFLQALEELEEEGGVAGRAARYRLNNMVLMKGMQELGFQAYLPPDRRGYIINTFLYPDHPNFDFQQFYWLLNEKDQVIYPGKLSKIDCFRLGNIGRIDTSHITRLLEAIRETLQEMKVILKEEKWQ